MMKKNEHETLREKFWDWWEYTSLEEMVISGLVLVIVTAVAVVLTAFVVWLFMQMFGSNDLPADEPAEGVGRNPAVVRYLSPAEAEEIRTAWWLDEYTEGESPVPAWWNPDEPMSAVWEEPNPAGYGSNPVQTAENEPLKPRMTITEAEPHAPEGIDPGGIDWNICTTVWGWDGHGAEVWEMDLFARVYYLEFWQPDMVLCEAGCDAILRLWESGEKGRTLGEVLSSRNEDGSWTYSVYPDIWTTDYDEDGLEWCRHYTAERFAEGPVWIAPYFRLDYYHDWAVPAYQIGNVYFSVAK